MSGYLMRSKVIQANKTAGNQVSACAYIEQIDLLLRGGNKILVASHIDPDGDALGTQLAFAQYLASLGKEIYLVRYADIPDKYQFLPGVESIRHYDEFENNFSVDTALILECPDLARVGRISSALSDSVKIINLDHHLDNGNFGAVNWISSGSSSVGEMAFEYFEKVGYEVDYTCAQLLYTAILTDTGRFRFPSTSPKTMRVVASLLETGINPQEISDQIYFNMPARSLKLIGKVLNGIEYHDNNRICILGLTRAMYSMAGAVPADSDGIVDYTMYSRGTVAGALVKEIDGQRSKISFRSRGKVNVAEIAGRHGGGGHMNASGCSLDLPYEEARTMAVKLLKEALNG